MSPQPAALVTGSGAKRVGWYVADALARRGFALAIHYHRSAAEAADTVSRFRAAGAEAEPFQADLTDDAAVNSLMDGVFQRFGRLDVLVNCAAIWQRRPLEDVTADDVRRHFDTNVLGTFLCSQRAGLAMVKQTTGGLIVTVGDWAEARPYRNYAAYFASKGAIGALTRCLANELAFRNPKVRVNCILPGPVMLPPDLSDAERRRSIDGTLVKHEGSPQNIAQAVLSFLDNDFVTGVCLPVDGGRTIFSAE